MVCVDGGALWWWWRVRWWAAVVRGLQWAGSGDTVTAATTTTTTTTTTTVLACLPPYQTPLLTCRPAPPGPAPAPAGKAKGAVQRIFPVIDRQSAIDPASEEGAAPPTIRGVIELRAVSPAGGWP